MANKDALPPIKMGKYNGTSPYADKAEFKEILIFNHAALLPLVQSGAMTSQVALYYAVNHANVLLGFLYPPTPEA